MVSNQFSSKSINAFIGGLNGWIHKILPYMSRAERITINILITLVGLSQYKKPKVKGNLTPGKLKQVASKLTLCRICISKF